jgi:hypothetical protein
VEDKDAMAEAALMAADVPLAFSLDAKVCCRCRWVVG